MLPTAAEFLNSAYGAAMTSLHVLVVVEQDHYCWASSLFMNMTDQPAPNFCDCNCDPFKAKSCSLCVKEGTTTHKSNRMRTVY